MADHMTVRILLVSLCLLVLCGPMPARAEEVEIDGLAATLLEPEGGEPVAAAVLIAGSGPTDRNGNSYLGLNTNAYKLLAEALAGRGITTLRFDKRGVGGSAKSPRPELEIVFQHYVDDVTSIARWLQTRTGFTRLFLVGHSEGGTMALMAAQKMPVAGIALLTAPGRTLGTILREQFSRPGKARDLTREAMRIIAALEQGDDVPEVSPRLAAAFRPSVQPYLRSSINLDPAELARAASASILIVGGGRDFQIGKSDFDDLYAARPDAVAYWDPDMAHTLKPSRSDAQSVKRAYTDPEFPLAVGLPDRVADFILSIAK